LRASGCSHRAATVLLPGLGLDEGEKVGVDLVLMRGAQTVRSALVDLQGGPMPFGGSASRTALSSNEKPPHKMTDDELETLLWKTEQQLREMGVDLDPTEEEIAQARTRRF
jgi:hypothetical protein